MFCPWDIRRYGGDVCYVQLFEHHPADDTPNRRGNCFPAGHASGGFALIGLFALARGRVAKLVAIAFALMVGWVAGGYQMVTGAHYASHTLISMMLAWIIFLFWRRALRLAADEDSAELSSVKHSSGRA